MQKKGGLVGVGLDGARPHMEYEMEMNHRPDNPLKAISCHQCLTNVLACQTPAICRWALN